jgi:hypothetical protein
VLEAEVAVPEAAEAVPVLCGTLMPSMTATRDNPNPNLKAFPLFFLSAETEEGEEEAQADQAG